MERRPQAEQERTGNRRLALLDAGRLSGGNEALLEAALAAADLLEEVGLLEIHLAPSPAQLAEGLRARGFQVEQESGEDGGLSLRVSRRALPPLRDLSGLEPPGPLEQVLLATSRLLPGEVFLARLPRFPRMLVPHLEQRRLEWEIHLRPDGTATLWARAPR